MNITKQQLKQLIKEEIGRNLDYTSLQSANNKQPSVIQVSDDGEIPGPSDPNADQALKNLLAKVAGYPDSPIKNMLIKFIREFPREAITMESTI